MLEFQIDDNLYRAKKLNTFQQMRILRRIGPIIGPLLGIDPGEGGGNGTNTQLTRFLTALHEMTDDDCDYVIKLCCGVVQRMQAMNGSGVWADIFNNRTGTFMFDDIDNLMMAMEITGKVLTDNLGGFLSTREGETVPPSQRPSLVSSG